MNIVRLKTAGANSYAITNDKDWILVDTGKSYTKLSKAIQKNGLKMDHLKLIILTHFHSDHGGAVNKLVKRHGKIKTLAHKVDAEVLESGYGEIVGGTIRLTKFLELMLKKFFKGANSFDPIHIDIAMETEYDLRAFGFDAKIIHIPGHTEGSVGVIIANQMIIGDTLFHILSWNLISIFAYNKKVLYSTCENLLNLSMDQYHVGHGKKVSHELFQSQILRLKKKLS